MNDGLVIVLDAEKRRIWVSLKVYLTFNAGERSPCSIALFLPVQFEELQRSLLMDVHDLPSVRFVTTCLSV